MSDGSYVVNISSNRTPECIGAVRLGRLGLSSQDSNREMKMRIPTSHSVSHIAAGLSIVCVLLLSACSKPTDIVFGPEPLKQMAEQGDQFKKMPEEDRGVLVGYLGIKALSKEFGAKDDKPITGRTVGEVLVDARAWKAAMLEKEAAEKKKEAEAAALKASLMEERKAISAKILSSVTITLLNKSVVPKNLEAGRFDSELKLTFAVENKSDKPIKLLKTRIYFKDATGDDVGWLSNTFDETIPARSTLKSSSSYWKINEFRNGDIEKIANRELSAMTASFEPKSVAFGDGEVIKAPSESD